MVGDCIEDVRGFAVEKYGIAPDIMLHDHSHSAVAVCMREYVKFVLSEVLKNAVQALEQKYGAWDIDEAPPVAVTLHAGSACNEKGSDNEVNEGSRVDEWCVEVVDQGPGMDRATLAAMQQFFSTTTEEREATYGYSKAHGAQFSGQGVGIPMTQLYVDVMGGRASWHSEVGSGTKVRIALPVCGPSLTCP